jgi:hypothetical protein
LSRRTGLVDVRAVVLDYGDNCSTANDERCLILLLWAPLASVAYTRARAMRRRCTAMCRQTPAQADAASWRRALSLTQVTKHPASDRLECITDDIDDIAQQCVSARLTRLCTGTRAPQCLDCLLQCYDHTGLSPGTQRHPFTAVMPYELCALSPSTLASTVRS